MKSGGGAGASAGFTFQHRLAAWWATRILGEASLGLTEIEQATPSFLQCESSQPVDDIMLRMSNGGFVFVQAKGGALRLSRVGGSEFGKAIDQFVRQFRTGRPDGTSLDARQDRLVLAVAPDCSGSISQNLRSSLRRLRGLADGEPVAKVARNEPEHRAVSATLDHVNRCWRSLTGENPSDGEVRKLLSLIDIRVFALEAGGSDEQTAKDLLRNGILGDPSQADVAWDRLNASCAQFATERSGGDARRLQALLSEAGIRLRAAPSYRRDIEHLCRHSKTTASLLRRFSLIRLKSQQIKIRRRSTEELERLILQTSLVVVGEPGAGKSGALYDVAENLLVAGYDVVFLAADRSSAESMGALRQALSLQHEIIDVLKSWPGPSAAFLIIDGLDAARAESVGRTLRDLIRLVVEEAPRWRILASIRRFDLRHSTELQDLFRRDVPAVVPGELRDQEFEPLSHLRVPVLDDAELTQIAEQSEALGSLVAAARPELKRLLRVPFNLHLLAELLDVGVGIAELAPVRTQIELLERYWKARVKLRDDSYDRLGDARELVARVTCEAMLELRSLRVERARIGSAETSEALAQLLSSQVLQEDEKSDTLSFEHHIIFDYAVARLLLRGPVERLIQRLENDPDLPIVIRPSLVLHFQYLWIADQTRQDFWNSVLAMIASEEIPEIGKLVGPSVAAELGKELRDFQPLLLDRSGAQVKLASLKERTVGHLIGALLAKNPNELVGSGPWCALLEALSQ